MVKYSNKIPDFRQHVPALREWSYLETASTGLVPDFVYEGTRKYIDDRYYRGGDSEWAYGNETTATLDMMCRSKAALARMIHGRACDIAFGLSSTQLFTMVTDHIDYAENDNIVTVQGGWIGSRFAWQKRQQEGMDIRFIYPKNGIVSAEMLIAACDEQTRAVAVNLVESTTGYRIDIDTLGAFCRENDILLFVDGVQGLGVLEVNVERSNIDFLVGNDYKWMMNFCGTGFAYVSPRVRELVTRWGAGWMSDVNRFDTDKERLEIRSDAGRYEIGHQHNDGIYGLGLVAEQNLRLGIQNIENYVMGLADYFRKRTIETDGIRLSYDIPSETCSQIVSVKIDNSTQVSDQAFLMAKVYAHLRPEDQNGEREMRLGFHYYNNLEDIDRFFDVIHAYRRHEEAI